jgi:porin
MVNYETGTVVQAGGTRLTGDMEVIQADYNVALAPGMTLGPFYEYIINPNPGGFVTTRVKNASEVGGMLQIALPDLLGLPTLARVN